MSLGRHAELSNLVDAMLEPAPQATHDTFSCLLQAGDSQMVLGPPMADQAAVMQAGMGVGDPAHQQGGVHQVGLIQCPAADRSLGS